MRGIILAGGLATRLGGLSLTQNKHLLPVFDKPMIYYPINTLTQAGIKDIMIIVSGPYAGNFFPVLKNGEEFNCKITYAYQSKPDGGIADALALAEDFAKGHNICVILGDNTTDAHILKDVQVFDSAMNGTLGRAHLFLKEVPDPRGFGVVQFDHNNIIERIIEKPINPPSNMAVTGVYIYDGDVFKFIKQCSPSGRGQLEITDVNNLYLQNGAVSWGILDGFWQDAGTVDNLFLANQYWARKHFKECVDTAKLSYSAERIQNSFK